MIFIVLPCLVLLYILLINFLYELFCAKEKSVQEKHVVVIGGSSGIGKAFACLAAQKGAHVTIIARNEDRLRLAVEEIKKDRLNDSQRTKSISLDVSDYDQVNGCLLSLDDELPIYMLMNCAGLAICGIIEDVSEENVKKMFDVNYYGTHNAIKTLVPRFKTRKEGHIVLTGSQASLLGIYGYTTYAATKFALRGLAEALAMELKHYNIHVTLALPPDTNTPGFQEENKSKPEETRLITESAGIYQPKTVAQAILKDVLKGSFFSYIGMESFLLTTLCVGMTSHRKYYELAYHCILLGPFKLISSFYLGNFHKIINDCAKKNKKAD
ncbi:3-ketodihydrosphingosine reductase [Onthophagus taurus]|uniref:3-ketodihydrosphingosine reductase n=1 Tax=Onthophagus taurus TaxID=166361 RepID=UPI000C20E4B6|nr:3-ketodihydrosphingosine reductase [Onthophagus taurus]